MLFRSGNRNGLYKYNRELNDFFTYTFAEEKNYDVLSIYEDLDNNIWVGTWNNGLLKLSHSTNQFQVFCPGINHIRSICEYQKSFLLLGSDDGLFLFNTETLRTSRIDNPKDPDSLSDHNVYAIYTDRERGIWVGTYFGGVNYFSYNVIKHYRPNSTANSLSGKVITQFCEDKNKNIWIATADGGLNYFDRKYEKFTTYLPKTYKDGLSYDNIQSLLLDNELLWCGTFSAGIDVFNTRTHVFKHYRFDSSDACIFSLYKTPKEGSIYVGTNKGLKLYNREKDNFIQIKEVSAATYDIKVDHLGYLWVATKGRGAFRYNPNTKEWKNYRHNPNTTNSICFDRLISIYLDEKQRLWFCSEGGGICKYNYETDDFSTINFHQGLKSDVVYGILDDALGNIWISSNSGITKINPNTMKIERVYTKDDGLQSNQFNFKSSFKASDGSFFFGGINGFNVFNPNDLTGISNKHIPPVVLTKFELLSENGPQEIILSKKIVLKHSQSSFNIHFACLSYKVPEKNNHAYMLKGLDSKWNNIGNQRNVSYINLPHGKYVFLLKGSNNDDLWNEEGASVEIVVLPPFWKSKKAIAIYIFFLLSIIYITVRLFIHKTHKKQQRKLEQFHKEKEREVYDSKINFFTNIAHEIRTPVSLIKAPLECIISSGEGSSDTKENLTVIEKNTNLLLELINQLLDFRKVEEQSYKLKFVRADINEILADICFRFRPAAESQRLNINLQLPEQKIYAFIDKEAITKVISNVLTNALKHAVGIIDIKLTEAEQSTNGFFEIKVSDDGVGIDDEMKEKIFEPFFQIDNNNTNGRKTGTGIGLALATQLVKRHEGDIFVSNNADKKGSVFVIRIPKRLDCTDSTEEINEFEEQDVKIAENNQFDSDKTVILVVEDNEELRAFLSKNLSKEHIVITASDGKKALQNLDEYPVDLIISDIVMPEMDGLEFAKIIKQNEQYSHIPIILLSAKTNIQTKVEGLEYGADSYIEKPFSIIYLKAQINSLIENRMKILKKFLHSPIIPYGTIAHTKKDELFLDKLNEIIEQNMSNEQFSIEKLAFSLSMSQSNLQRKIKGISGMVPVDYIRLIKLKKAVELMKSGKYRINEICYMVGFSSPSYFTKCFQKQFDMLPKDYMNN